MEYVNVENIPDKLTQGLCKVRDKITSIHPVENVESQEELEDPICNISLGLKLKLAMEKELLKKVNKTTIIATKNLSLNVISDKEFGFSDMLNNFSETTLEPRMKLEKQL